MICKPSDISMSAEARHHLLQDAVEPRDRTVQPRNRSSQDRCFDDRGLLIFINKLHTPLPKPKPWSKKGKKPRLSRQQTRQLLSELESKQVPQLFQDHPLRKARGFPPSGYTKSIEAFLKSARQRCKVVLKNNHLVGKRFTHLCNINLTSPQHPEILNRDFKAFIKILEEHAVSGHWTIQIDKKNIVHWHLLFQNYHGNAESLKCLVQRCLKLVKTFPKQRVFTDSIKNQKQKLEYVLQVEKAGYGEIFNPLDKQAPKRSHQHRDIYANDRILFTSGTGLNKNGTFGNFWAKQPNGKPHSEKTLWKKIRTETETVENNYKHPHLRKQVQHLHERLGIPLQRAKWSICLDATPQQPCQPLQSRLNSSTHPEASALIKIKSQRLRSKGARRNVRSIFRKRCSLLGFMPKALKKQQCCDFVGLLRDRKTTHGASPSSLRHVLLRKVSTAFQAYEIKKLLWKTFDLGP